MARSIPAIITPSVLSWARQLDQITLDEAANKVNVPMELVQDWENGTAQPSLKQAKDLAKFYRVPFAYFYLPDAPKRKTKRIEKVDYRTFGNIGDRFVLSRELRWLLRDVEDRRDAVLDLYKKKEQVPHPFGFHSDQVISAQDLSLIIRQVLHLSKEKQCTFRKSDVALTYCIRELEKQEVLVFQASGIDPKEMRGVSAGYDILPYIVLNRKDETSARLFTLCHELAHIVLSNSALCNDISENSHSQSNMELFCNEVAGLALVPNDEIKEHPSIQKIREYGFDDSYVGQIARDFAVSKYVIIHRLWKIGVISQDFYFSTLNRYDEEYKRRPKKTDGFVPPALDKGTQVGRLYTRMVLDAFNSERITIRETSHLLLDLNAKHFDAIERWCK